MARALVEAMLTPEGLIIGAAWVALWAAITCTAFIVLEAIERRGITRRHGLNMARPARGEASKCAS